MKRKRREKKIDFGLVFLINPVTGELFSFIVFLGTYLLFFLHYTWYVHTATKGVRVVPWIKYSAPEDTWELLQEGYISL
jgi:hypothetical protein